LEESRKFKQKQKKAKSRDKNPGFSNNNPGNPNKKLFFIIWGKWKSKQNRRNTKSAKFKTKNQKIGEIQTKAGNSKHIKSAKSKNHSVPFLHYGTKLL
jgi:hypothetical protein